MNKYLKTFYNSNALADCMPIFGNYKNATKRDKEITESFGCLEASFRYSGFDKKDPEVQVYVIGDGIRPRTGAIFAYFTSWSVISIDPIMDLSWWEKYTEFKKAEGFPVKRLEVIGEKIEDRSFWNTNKSIVVMPHSHVTIETTLRSFSNNSFLVVLPCCTKIDKKYTNKKYVDNNQFRFYTDEDILSPKNEVYLWSNINRGY